MPVIYDIGDADSGPPSDQDELIRLEESDSSSDSEETPATCSARASLNRETTDTNVEELVQDAPVLKEKLDFCVTGLTLSLSATALTIIYPAYLGTATAASNSYVALLFPSSSCLFLLLLAVVTLKWLRHFDGCVITRCSLPMKRLSIGALSYAVGSTLVVLAQLPGRVPCHLQDPVKAVIILFSLLYYFFFCKRMLGLRKLFAASVLAVGLFIAADYGLCDEFKCRGMVAHIEGSWEARTTWTVFYLIGLGLFTLHFTITEEYISQRPVDDTFPSESFLSTVSRIVSHNETFDQTQLRNSDSTQNLLFNDKGKYETKLCILMSLWVQTITWIFIFISGALVIIASIATGIYLPRGTLTNSTLTGLMCHLPHFNSKESVHHSVSSIPVNGNPTTDGPFTRISEKLLELDIQYSKLHEGRKAFKQAKEDQVRADLKSKRNRNRNAKVEKLNNETLHSILANTTTTPDYPSKIREKRNAVESLASGYKIITPTMSILKDHVIMNKIKPLLLGHIILNKTDANIFGHQLSANLDMHGSDVEHYYRRGGQNIKVSESDEEEPPIAKLDQVKKYIKIDKKNAKVKSKKMKKTHRRHKRFDDESYFTRSSNSSNNTNSSKIDGVDGNFVYAITKLDKNECRNTAAYGWVVVLSYTSFSISSIRFLKLCQSSVFTVAMMTPALPMAGMWWAIFTQNSDGNLIVEPTMSGELICSMLSLPIIILGLTLLFKAQLNQSFCGKSSRKVNNQNLTGLVKIEDHMYYPENGVENELKRSHTQDI